MIDGRYGYVGSQNIVDRDFKPGIVNQELMVRVEGPVVQQLQATFMADWFLETTEVLRADTPQERPTEGGNAVLQVLPSGPDYAGTGIEHLVVALVHNARERIVVVTPYFVPDGALLNAMKIAVLRGVDVRLVVSKVADQKLVRLAQRSYYAELLRAGIHIHLYRDRLLHAKNMSVDRRMGLVGSSNFDIRSFVLNSEISLIIYDEASVGGLVDVQETYLAGSDVLTLDAWGQAPLRHAHPRKPGPDAEPVALNLTIGALETLGLVVAASCRRVGPGPGRERRLNGDPQVLELFLETLEANSIELVVQGHDLEFRLQVDLVVQSRGQPVPGGLTVLGHQDDRRLERGDHRQDQVEEDERIGIELAVSASASTIVFSDHPGEKHPCEDDDEAPRAAKLGDAVRHALPEGFLGRKNGVHVLGNVHALRNMRDDALFARRKASQAAVQQFAG